MLRALRLERRNLKTLPGPDTQTTSPGHQGVSLKGEVSTFWCVRGFNLREPEWVHPVPSPERGGVARVYIFFL